MDDFLVVYTPKKDGVDESAVKRAALKAYPGYYVRQVGTDGAEFEVHLAKLADRVSARKRHAAPPKDDVPAEADAEADSPDDDPEASDPSDESDDSDKGDKGDKKDKGDSKPKDPVQAIEKIMTELQSLLGELGGHAQSLKEKADKVDEIHEMSTPDGSASMDAVPPMSDAAEIGPTPGGGGPPSPPRKPPVPAGGSGRGMPSAFTKRRTEVVDHPIKDDDGEYSVSDVEAAVKADARFAGYIVDEVRRDGEKGVYHAKLLLAE